MVTQKPTTKTRSPNYPAINLGDAIGHVRTIYRAQNQHPTTREVLAKLMGYKGLNGASATMVSALSKYGLIEGYGDDLRVSNLGRDLVIHRSEDMEYRDAIELAAFAPPFFRELHENYGDILPSEHALRTSLIKRGFNDKAIPNVVRAYRDTMDLVEEARGTASFTDSFPAGIEEEMVHSTTALGAHIPGAPAPLRTGTTQQAIQFPVSESGWVVLQTPESMSESEWDLMMTILGSLKRARVSSHTVLSTETSPEL